MHPTASYYIPSDKRNELKRDILTNSGVTEIRSQLCRMIDTLSLAPISESEDSGRVTPMVRMDDDLEWRYEGDVPAEYVQLITEILTGDVRLLIEDDTTADSISNWSQNQRGSLFRRDFSGYVTVDSRDRPTSWHRIDSVESEYRMDMRGRHPVKGMIDLALKICERTRFSLKNGVVFRYSDCSEWYLRHMKKKVSSETEAIKTISLDMSEDEALSLADEYSRMYERWCSDGIENLRLMMAYPFVQPVPDRMIVLYGTGNSGKSSFRDRMCRIAGPDQSFVISFDSLVGNSTESSNTKSMSTRRLIAYVDDFDGHGLRRGAFLKAWGSAKSLLTGVLPGLARDLYSDSFTAPVRSHLIVCSNYDLGIEDDRSSGNANSRRISACVVSPSDEMVHLIERTERRFGSDWPELLASCEAWADQNEWSRSFIRYQRSLPDHQYEADAIVRYLMDHRIYLLKSGEILDSSGVPITGSRQFGYGWLQSIGVKKGTPRKLNGKSSATWIPDLESDSWRESVSRVSKSDIK